MLVFGKLTLASSTCGWDCDDLELCIRGNKWLGGESFPWRHRG